MSLEEVFEYCAELGFDAVDPTGYYFPGYPDPPPDEFIYQIRRKAFVLGLDISGTGVRNNFAAAENPAADIDHVKKWVEVAEKMGAPTVRVFAGEASVGHSEDEVSRWLVDSLKTCAEYGKQHGIMIGLQPHHDFLKTAAQVLDVLERVDSEWVGLNLDVGSLRAGDPYEEIALLAPHAITWQIKDSVYRKGNEERADLSRIVEIVRQSGYRGYLPLETLGPESAQNLPAFLNEVRQALNR
ncbi:MAG: sugar phosphate isomerase/epimerase family protein [Rhodothermales bacterium]